MNNKKFEIRDGQLVFQSTGEAIPEAEPVFVLRGIDSDALSILRVYQAKMRPGTENWRGIQSVIEDFEAFRVLNPLIMLPPAVAYLSKPK